MAYRPDGDEISHLEIRGRSNLKPTCRGSSIKYNAIASHLASTYGSWGPSGRLGTPDTHGTPSSPSSPLNTLAFRHSGTESEMSSFALIKQQAKKTQRLHSYFVNTSIFIEFIVLPPHFCANRKMKAVQQIRQCPPQIE